MSLYGGTIVLHTIQGLLALLSVLYLLLQRQNFQVSPLKKYIAWFVFFIFYNIALIVSSLIYDSSPLLSALGYQIGLVLLAIGAWQAFVTGLELLPFSRRMQRMLALSYILGVLITVGFHAIFFRTSQAFNDDWILWSPNQFAIFPYVLFMFVAGWTFSLVFARGFFSVPHPLLKIRALLMSLSGFILPVAGPFYFMATDLVHYNISIGIVAVGLVFFLAGNIGIGFIKRNSIEL